MKASLSRRQFLKLSGAAVAGVFIPRRDGLSGPFTPVFPYPEEQDQGLLARVAKKEIDLYAEPRDGAAIIGKRYRDQLVHIYYETIPPDAPLYYNRLWYRVWGGYIHSTHLQIVQVRHNEPAGQINEAGELCEVTVPYTVAYQRSKSGEWTPWRGSRLYYETTHWATALEEGPDGQPWYQITSELSDSEIYYVPAIHTRIMPPDEWGPISTDVPPDKKRIDVSIKEQMVRAYEHGKLVFETRISSGLRNPRLSSEELPTHTPTGDFAIYSKLPNKHMGSITGNPDSVGGFSLPGVPWTCFFRYPGGYAFHGTYWHNNFGLQMSHGCVNMRNEDARWLFRWCTPEFDSNVKDRRSWEARGHGTYVHVE